MVSYEKKKEEPISQTKSQILDALAQESDTVLSLAYMYAKGHENFGEDVTKRWQTTALQTDALNRAYKQGFDDAVKYLKGEKVT